MLPCAQERRSAATEERAVCAPEAVRAVIIRVPPPLVFYATTVLRVHELLLTPRGGGGRVENLGFCPTIGRDGGV